MQKIDELLNLGPASQKMLKTIGIQSPEDLSQCDAVAVYLRLKATQQGVSLNLLYAILGFQQGIRWQEVRRTQKAQILAKIAELD